MINVLQISFYLASSSYESSFVIISIVRYLEFRISTILPKEVSLTPRFFYCLNNYKQQQNIVLKEKLGQSVYNRTVKTEENNMFTYFILNSVLPSSGLEKTLIDNKVRHVKLMKLVID